ncbi:MAG: hypothetical protein M3R24_31725, partial [Chloroflexota bacterium]|nr:hypothetical protein [Chloroflexota bacterium]
PGVLSLGSFSLTATEASGQPVTQFNRPYTLKMSYNPAAARAAGVDESRMSLAYWDGTQWINMMPCAGCAIDPTTQTITISADHFTEFMIVGGNLQALAHDTQSSGQTAANTLLGKTGIASGGLLSLLVVALALVGLGSIIFLRARKQQA